MVALENLDNDQKENLKKLRENLQELLGPEHDDDYLLRFLVARNFDVSLATEMLRKHLQYWKRNGLNRIQGKIVYEKKNEYFFTAMLGFNREGSLVRLLRLGQADIKGLVLSHTRHEAFKVLVQMMYEDRIAQRQRTQEYGDGKDGKMCYVMDLKGLPWKLLFYKPAGRYTSFILGMYEANFPEWLKTVYIVNAPGFFGMILSFLKKVLPSEILNKIVILKSGEVESILEKVMDLSIVPADIGGTRTDPDGDPSCSSLHPVKPGTPIPHEYYLSTQENYLEKDPNAKTAIIPNQSTFSIPTVVDIPQSILSWDFRTVEKDIAMGLRFIKKGDEQPEIRIRPHKVDSHKYTESGKYICEEPGTYELFFDNTYSWFSKKELMYKVNILPPLDDDKYCSNIMQNLTLQAD